MKLTPTNIENDKKNKRNSDYIIEPIKTVTKQDMFLKKSQTDEIEIEEMDRTEVQLDSTLNVKLDQTSVQNVVDESRNEIGSERNPNEQTYIMNFVQQRKRFIDVAIQNNILQEEKGAEEMRLELQQSEPEENSVSDDNDDDSSSSDKNNGLLKSELTTSNFDHQNLEKFLFNKFSRSVEEWIVDFNEIEFDNLIATGSTCHVHKGLYKSLPVAIKKLLRPENEKKIKFLKEFKREISILVSLPAHPSLLTLIGFCINDGTVYLLTEFCEGGTLFDILYRKSLGFKLS